MDLLFIMYYLDTNLLFVCAKQDSMLSKRWIHMTDVFAAQIQKTFVEQDQTRIGLKPGRHFVKHPTISVLVLNLLLFVHFMFKAVLRCFAY